MNLKQQFITVLEAIYNLQRGSKVGQLQQTENLPMRVRFPPSLILTVNDEATFLVDFIDHLEVLSMADELIELEIRRLPKRRLAGLIPVASAKRMLQQKISLEKWYTYLTENQTLLQQCRFKSHRTITSDTYWGSGSILQSAYKKYGRENFIKEILISGYFSQQEINALEIEYIKKERSIGKAEYNISEGGDAFVDGHYYWDHASDEQKEWHIQHNKNVASKANLLGFLLENIISKLYVNIILISYLGGEK